MDITIKVTTTKIPRRNEVPHVYYLIVGLVSVVLPIVRKCECYRIILNPQGERPL
jgi:hypothetical protein